MNFNWYVFFSEDGIVVRVYFIISWCVRIYVFVVYNVIGVSIWFNCIVFIVNCGVGWCVRVLIFVVDYVVIIFVSVIVYFVYWWVYWCIRIMV